MTAVFISYRRIDTNWAAVALRHHITKTFPGTEVFQDIASIDPGEDFVEVINATVDKCEVLLAIIGPNWLTVSTNQGRRRLDIESDFVRLEIARALARGVRVVPVLVDDADMPPSEELPEDLKPLATKNAVTVAHHSNERDFDAISEFLERHLELQRGPAFSAQTVTEPVVAAEPLSDIGDAVAQALLDAGTDPKTMISVANMRYASGDYAVEEAILTAAHPGLVETEGEQGEWVLALRNNLALAKIYNGRVKEAEKELSSLLAERESLIGEDNLRTLSTRNNLALATLNDFRAKEAELAFAALLLDRERVQGKDDPDTHLARENLGYAILSQNRTQEAQNIFSSLLSDRIRSIGEKDSRTLGTRRLLILAALENGDWETAKSAATKLPEGGGDPRDSKRGRTFLLRAWLSDLDGKANEAEKQLTQAKERLAKYSPGFVGRRELAKYLETRTPGQPGGTTLWMLDEKPDA